MGKARVAPMKIVLIPRLELTAATVSVKMGAFLCKELDNVDIESIRYYTNSMTVLRYLNNKKKRFPVFVSIRVRLIHDFTETSQWRYIDTKNNPADLASRGMKGNELAGKNVWLAGPEFLAKPEVDWPEQPTIKPEEEEDEEKEVSAAASATENKDVLTDLLESHSDWFKLKKTVAILKRFAQYLQAKTLRKEELKSVCTPITAEDLQQAELAILKYLQMHCFEKEVSCLQNKQT